MSCGSAIISPSMFDIHNSTDNSNLSCEVETDFFDTFQISAVASNISSLISAKCEEKVDCSSGTKPKHGKFTMSSFTSPVASIMKSKPKASKKDGSVSPQDNTQCKCKKSQCLKLYCDCFASAKYCHPSCKCVDCMNTKDSESFRQDAIKQISERKPALFSENTPKAAACLSGEYDRSCSFVYFD